MSDGKQLEALVAFVEKTLLPTGFSVNSNERVFNDDGVQIAEFDIEIRGKVGSTTIAWLIECRDRPGQGAAPGSWIEQLVGRRHRFGFNKVTAVSTTGFAVGAADFAAQAGIELREVRSIEPTEFQDWLQLSAIHQHRHVTKLQHATVYVGPEEPESIRLAVTQKVLGATSDTEFLISSSTGARATMHRAFFGAVQSLDSPFDGITVDQPRKVRVVANYQDSDHFLIETEHGQTRVTLIDFIGELYVEEEVVPVLKTVEYRHAGTGEPISQLASFAPQSSLDLKFSIELHHMADSGETHVTMRRLPDDA